MGFPPNAIVAQLSGGPAQEAEARCGPLNVSCGMCTGVKGIEHREYTPNVSRSHRTQDLTRPNSTAPLYVQGPGAIEQVFRRLMEDEPFDSTAP